MFVITHGTIRETNGSYDLQVLQKGQLYGVLPFLGSLRLTDEAIHDDYQMISGGGGGGGTGTNTNQTTRSPTPDRYQAIVPRDDGKHDMIGVSHVEEGESWVVAEQKSCVYELTTSIFSCSIVLGADAESSAKLLQRAVPLLRRLNEHQVRTLVKKMEILTFHKGARGIDTVLYS
jgi:hypothetical protein